MSKRKYKQQGNNSGKPNRRKVRFLYAKTEVGGYFLSSFYSEQ